MEEKLASEEENNKSRSSERNPEIEKIIGATDEFKELMFLVKWHGQDAAALIPAKLANELNPHIVIKFYEEILEWPPSNPDKKDRKDDKDEEKKECKAAETDEDGEENEGRTSEKHGKEGKKPRGFDRGLEPEKILGITKFNEEIVFLMEWRGSDIPDIIPASQAHMKCPQLVIQFYHERLKFVPEEKKDS